MKFNIRCIFTFMTWTARRSIQAAYGLDFYRNFVRISKDKLNAILANTPDIGESIFKLNYQYGPCYFAWYAALLSLDIERETALGWIWQINEDFVKFFPKPLLHWFARNMYLGAFRKMAVVVEQRGQADLLHPGDWRMAYVNIDANTFGLNISECGMLKLAEHFGYLDMFPSICRMDYLFSHYFGNGFTRRGTLADGDALCDCVYQFPGSCEWAPEKGFANRK